jgi:hypothetical protein
MQSEFEKLDPVYKAKSGKTCEAETILDSIEVAESRSKKAFINREM